MSDSTPFIPSEPDDKMGEIALPFSKDQFSEFLQGLLGDSQAIERHFGEPFVLSPIDLKGIHEALLIRVKQQNAAKLVSFSAKVLFEDESSVSFASPDSFFTYGEVKPIQSIVVIVKWIFLVHFPDKEVPEKQVVTFSACGHRIPERLHHFLPTGFLLGKGHPRHGINVRIEHTARTWGSDIENVLTNQVQHIQADRSWWSKFIEDNSHWFWIGVVCVIIAGSVASSLLAVWAYASRLRELARNATGLGINEQIEYVLSLVSSGVWPQFTFICLLFIIIVSMLATVSSVVLGGITAIPEMPSFVLFSNRSERMREKFLRKRELKERGFFVSLGIELIAGVAVSIIYALYFEHLIG